MNTLEERVRLLEARVKQLENPDGGMIDEGAPLNPGTPEVASGTSEGASGTPAIAIAQIHAEGVQLGGGGDLDVAEWKDMTVDLTIGKHHLDVGVKYGK